MVFAGDEIGLTGVDGEHARTPFPWRRRDEWDDATLEAYRTWIAVRREHVALRRGGLRWLAADGDSMTYLREHPEQTVLVHLTRAPTQADPRAAGAPWARTSVASPRSSGSGRSSRATTSSSPAPAPRPSPWW